jgi:6-phosphogluconolactonase
VTLTAPVLKGAMNTIVLITGAEKRAALERAHATLDPVEAPMRLRSGAGHGALGGVS